MTVTETVSAKGGYKVFSSQLTATIATAFSEVIDALEAQNISMNQTQFQLVTDATATAKYMLVAICRSH